MQFGSASWRRRAVARRFPFIKGSLRALRQLLHLRAAGRQVTDPSTPLLLTLSLHKFNVSPILLYEFP